MGLDSPQYQSFNVCVECESGKSVSAEITKNNFEPNELGLESDGLGFEPGTDLWRAERLSRIEPNEPGPEPMR